MMNEPRNVLAACLLMVAGTTHAGQVAPAVADVPLLVEAELTHSLFECAILDRWMGGSSSQLYMSMGLQHGRRVLTTLDGDPALFNRVMGSLPGEFLPPGPTADFRLGQGYSMTYVKLSETFPPIDGDASSIRVMVSKAATMFKEKNCMLLLK